MNKRLLFSLVLITLSLTQIACDKNNPKEELLEALDGFFEGPVKWGGKTSAMTMTTTQTDNQVSGTYAITGSLNESGTVSGSVLGLICNLTFRRSSPTAATFNTSVDISNGSDKLVGSFGNGAYTFELTRK